MLSHIPKYALDVYKKVEENGFEIFFVGGCVRDLILGKDVKDWDFATNAKPEEILKIYKEAFYDNKFGTVGIPVENGIIEVTTYRTERDYEDRRHPKIVEWGKTIEEDLARRDFTINAIALRIESGKKKIVDPFLGEKDIEAKIIRAVRDPNERFKEDALRLMRAIRFATQLNFNIEEKTWNSIIKDSVLISLIACERVRDELLKILASDYPFEGIMLLKNSKILEKILPELFEGVGVSQARPGRHHTTDVFTHNLLSLKFTPSKDPIIRFAALIHDIGKPRVASKDEEGLVIFHNHEIVGTNMAREICDRLKFSKKDKTRILNLLRWHMFTVDEKITDAAIRRFIRRVGVESVKEVMDLRIGDRLGGGTQQAESWRLKLFKRRIQEQLGPKPFSIEDLAIDGNDVMKELKIKPGPKVGELLEKLFKEVDEDLSKNKKEYLINRLKDIAKK